MNRFSAVSILVAFIGAAIIQITLADLKEVECKGQKYTLDENHQATIKECLGAVGVTSVKQLDVTNAGCFSKCNMMKHGLFDDAGKPHKEKILNMVDEHAPGPIKDEWKVAMTKCLDDEGGKIDVKSCDSFLPMTMCVHGAFMTICNP